MRSSVSILVVLLFCGWGTIAQEKVDVKKETVTKRVVVKDTTVETKVTSDIVKKKEIITLDGDEKEMPSNRTVVVEDRNEVVVDETTVDKSNSASIAEIKKRQQKELEASIRAEKEKAERERKALEDLEKQRQMELEAKKKQLEHRPKGMTKLSKKKDN